MTHQLTTTDLTVGYDDTTVINNLSTSLVDGAVTSIIGPNGCGKSTLLHTVARILRPRSGAALLDARDVRDYPSAQLARILGLMPQTPIAPAGITVKDLVGRGRAPYQGLFGRFSEQDHAAVRDAMEATDVAGLAERHVDELSGGQRQRVWIAMALAQQTDIILLDEPTTFLDVTTQLDILELMQRLNRERGVTVVMVLHDMNLAARFSDYLLAMRSGEVISTGTPAEVLTPDTLRRVFDLEAQVIPDPTNGRPLVVPIARKGK
ncbi:ABC transporter ATP-binding protein [Corynebacterium tapiri]|uniref:ABC transporter ATP-binding protein n=1 Tax=Corynebacterium tapiri TaxID=1448266 RepID=A0A5C4U463_9CORY|nr:ABC transporter ATP-binding protein [Corynebacterium tapiri]TNL98469.1 ABC transporter ATP-binding protein [Corynebacterium tapiri]